MNVSYKGSYGGVPYGESDAVTLDIGDLPPPTNCITFETRECPHELFSIIEEPSVGGDVRLEAGKGTDQDGDIYFAAGGKTLSLGNLLEIIHAMGYDHLIDDENNNQEVHCDYESARSVLQHG